MQVEKKIINKDDWKIYIDLALTIMYEERK